MNLPEAGVSRGLKRLTAGLLLSWLLSVSGPALMADEPLAEESGLSSNQTIRKLEDETLANLKKNKPAEQADALLHLGKVCFENHDVARAEKYISEALAKEERLDRPAKQVDLLVNLAILAALQRKNEEAFSRYRSALEIAAKNHLEEAVVLITDSLGTLCLKTGQLDDADQYFKKAFELGKASNNVAYMMNALINQASLCIQRKNPAGALQLLQQAVELCSKNDELDVSVGQALLHIARVQHDLNKREEAVAAYKKAIDVFRQEIDIESEANACWGLAETLYDMQRIAEARQYYQQALDTLKDEPDDGLKVSVLIGLGSAEADLGNSEEAQKTHSKAYDMALNLKLFDKRLEAVLQLGNDMLLNGFPEAGLYKLLEGEKLMQEASVAPALKGAFLMAIGRCYKTLGQVESASKYYDEALQIYDSIDDKQRKALALNSLAVLCLDNENRSDFDRYYSAAKVIYSDAADKRDLAVLDYNYAQYLFVTKQLKEANALYTQALEGIKDSGDRVAESMILRGLGLCQLAQGHPQQAIPFYEKALALAERSGSIEAQWDSHLGLGKCYKMLGISNVALEHLSKSVDLVEKERGQLSRDSFKTYNLDLRSSCFTELVDLYILMKRPYDALATAEKGRARAFLDMLSSRRRNRAVENFGVPLSSRAEPQANEAKQVLAMAPSEPGTRAVTVMPRASQVYSSTAISPANAAAPDINEIKELVKKSKSTVVEFFLLPDKIACWVIDPDCSIHMLPPIQLNKQQLQAKVALTYEAITHHPKNQDEVQSLARRRQDLLREMNDLLVKPIEPYLPRDESSVVTIIPHGPMFMVPFAALISEDKKFLVEKHTLAYLPAIGVLRATQKLEEAFAAQPDKLLAFGNPITKAIAFLGALPYSEKEVHDIAELFGAGNSLIKIGQEADKKTFEELAPKFSEIHLATHGLVDEDHPMQSSLILAPTKDDDGLLTVKDILSMKDLKAKLVVLSACQTGRGKITGDGVVGLSRAFIIAGTPSVLVSQWNVDDIITQFQMKSFYKNYLGHSGKSRALRQAQLDTIKFMEGADLGKGIEGIRANPRYWSAFQLIGDAG